MLLITANAGFCASDIRTAAVKFGLAMAGVILSSLFIYFGLTVYNKFAVKKNEDEILISPKNKDEAVKFFINRNRL